MNELKKIANSFEETLNDSSLHNVASGLAEAFTDSLLDDGLLKDIPIFGTIVGLGKTTLKITDLLFLKSFFSSGVNT